MGSREWVKEIFNSQLSIFNEKRIKCVLRNADCGMGKSEAQRVGCSEGWQFYAPFSEKISQALFPRYRECI
jgi:hypothetical protein